MKCARCGLDMPPNVKQCPKCGLTNEFEAPQAQGPSKMKPLIIGIAVLAGIALVALVFAMIANRGHNSIASVPGGRPGPASGLMSVPPGHAASGNLMGAPPGTPAPAIPNPGAPGKPKPSKEVLDYLNFVKGVEEHRQMLLKDTDAAVGLAAASGQANQMMKLMDLADEATGPDGGKAIDPLKDVKDETNRQCANWRSTIVYFDKVPAPAECREFSGAYRNVLCSETRVIADLATNLNSVNLMDLKDMSKLLSGLQKMKKDPSLQGNIDKAADDADGKLDQLASRYDMAKPFKVPKEEQTSGSIMGF